MINVLRYIYIAAALAATPLMASAATSIKAQLDSAAVLMGRLNGLKVEVVTGQGSHGEFLFNEAALDTMGMSLHSVSDVVSTPLGNDVVQLTRTYYIQAFDSGAYTLPQVLYAEAGDTLASNTPTLKVVPVDVSQKEDINPDADVMDPDRRWYDFLPDFLTDYWVWWLVGILVVAAGICAALIYTRKIEIKLPQKAPVPPDRIALRKLAKLRESKMWENGREKDYYTHLVDILREYLQRRFEIYAMEMTSTEIMQAVRSNPTAKISQSNINEIVAIADFVKFARVRPMPDDNVRSMHAAVRFVEETKLKPEDKTDASGQGGAVAVAGTQSITNKAKK